MPHRRAVCQKEEEKQFFFAVAITSRHPMQHVRAVLCFLYESALEIYVLAGFRLRSPALLSAAAPAAT